MKLSYYVNPSVSPGYGTRLFVHREALDYLGHVRDDLSLLSCWGGPDKNYDGWDGWEFPVSDNDANLMAAIDMLKKLGFAETIKCPWE